MFEEIGLKVPGPRPAGHRGPVFLALGLASLALTGCAGSSPTAAATAQPPVPEESSLPEVSPAGPSQREMVLDQVRVSASLTERVVILKEKVSDRYLPIWIGPAEAIAIALELEDVPASRPQTHDLLSSVIADLGGEVIRVVVSDLSGDTFYATLLLRRNGSVVEVDARPSDAIALAQRADAPIYAEDSVLERAGISLGEASDILLLLEERESQRPLD